MSTFNAPPRPSPLVWMKCPKGALVPKKDVAGQPKWAKFYNWPRDESGEPLPDAPDFPRPEDVPEVVVQVPYDQHHASLIVKGRCSVVKEPKAPAVKPPAKPDKKGDS